MALFPHFLDYNGKLFAFRRAALCSESFRFSAVVFDWPVCRDQDILFRNLDDMRRDEYVFGEWALKLFAFWAPLHPGPSTTPVSPDVACRRLLRQYCLSRPLCDVPGVDRVTRFWLAAWWYRLYGPLLAPNLLLSWADCSSYGEHVRFWLATAARIGPGRFNYKDPEMFCWDLDQYVTTAGIYFACCPLGGFNTE